MSLPIEHLSASSINLFLRCPRQWQEKYVFGIEGPGSSALVIGSAAHLGLSRLLKGEDPGPYWTETLLAEADREIVWKDSPEKAEGIAKKHVYDYYERVGKHLNVEETEQELLIDVGIGIPLLGYVDIVTPERIIDVKTTGYFNRKVALNPEWKLQANIYQISSGLPAEFHVLTRSKTDAICVPDSRSSDLYVPAPPPGETIRFVKQIFGVLMYYWETWGATEEWPGNKTHPWASKYCNVERCCQK